MSYTVCKSLQLLPHSLSRHAVERQAALLVDSTIYQGVYIIFHFSPYFPFHTNLPIKYV